MTRPPLTPGWLPTLALLCAVGACTMRTPPLEPPRPQGLELVARSQRQWTGVAATADGQVFVCFPRWSEDVPVSVARVAGNGELVPFPNRRSQTWAPGWDASRLFVCVQALHVDARGRLWVLDPANPRFEGVVPGGPKLVAYDPDSGQVLETIPLGSVASGAAYLNDVRVDAEQEVAYISESGRGALIVVDLKAQTARRVLDGHPSTRSEGLRLRFGGQTWLRPDGSAPQVHADGIALSPDRGHVYWQALTGKTLYRIPTRALRDSGASEAELAAQIEVVGRPGASDGILFGPDGRLYLTSLEESALKVWTGEGGVQVHLQDDRLVWPDSLAIAPERGLFVTTARIHEGAAPRGPYELYRVWLPE